MSNPVPHREPNLTGPEGQIIMDLKQIFILALCLCPAWTCKNRCFNETELTKAAQRIRNHVPLVLDPREPSEVPSNVPASCPLDLYQRIPEDIKDRSLSPWRYRVVTNVDYFPPTYVEAQCLCEGCITMTKNRTMVENLDYNSKAVLQSRGFLRREQSGCGKGKYRLKVEYRQVAVGCTCVTASTISS